MEISGDGSAAYFTRGNKGNALQPHSHPSTDFSQPREGGENVGGGPRTWRLLVTHFPIGESPTASIPSAESSHRRTGSVRCASSQCNENLQSVGLRQP